MNDSKFSSPCTVSDTLTTAGSSAELCAAHLNSHSNLKSLQRNASSSSPEGRKSNERAAPSAEVELFRGQGHG